MSKPQQTFRDRLKILMRGEKPYTWARRVGIEKGLFQYYWQREKIPTYENLLKIQRYSGCSLDWLLTGRDLSFGQIEDLPMKKVTGPEHGQNIIKLTTTIKQIKKVYKKNNTDDIELLESLLKKLVSKS